MNIIQIFCYLASGVRTLIQHGDVILGCFLIYKIFETQDLSSKLFFYKIKINWGVSSFSISIGPSGVRALPLAAGTNEGGHYFR